MISKMVCVQCWRPTSSDSAWMCTVLRSANSFACKIFHKSIINRFFKYLNINSDEVSGSCLYFSHLGNQCFLLASCDTIDLCDGCISGPTSPLLEDCSSDTTTEGSGEETTTGDWTTEVTTTTPPATTTTPLTTATQPTTTTSTPAPTTTTEEETTTEMETTTTAGLPACNVTKGLLCDEHDNLIMEVEHLNTPSDCQAICQNEAECNYWSHWREEHGEHWCILTSSHHILRH